MQILFTLYLAVDATSNGDNLVRKAALNAAGRTDEHSMQDQTTLELAVDFAGNVEQADLALEHGVGLVRKALIADEADIQTNPKGTPRIWVNQENQVRKAEFAGNIDQKSPVLEQGTGLVRKVVIDAAGIAEEVDEDHSGKDLGFQNNELPEATKSIVSRSQMRSESVKAQFTPLSNSSSSRLDTSNRSTEILHDIVRNGSGIQVKSRVRDDDGASADKVEKDQSGGKRLGLKSNRLSDAIRRILRKSHMRKEATKAQLALLSNSSSSQPDVANKSAGVLLEMVRNESAVNATSKFAGDVEDSASNALSELQITSTFVQIQKKVVVLHQEGFSTTTLILLVLGELLSCIVCGFIWHRWRADQCLREHALEELRTAVQHAAQHALLLKDNADWRQSLNKLRELRKDNFSKAHPIYTAIESHMDDQSTQAQLQSLFVEMSDGEQFLGLEKLNLIFTNLQVAIVANVRICMFTYDFSKKPPEECYTWLINDISQPLTFSTFLSIFLLNLVVCGQAILAEFQCGGSTQAEVEDGAFLQGKLEYSFQIRGQDARRGTITYGQRAGPSAQTSLDREGNDGNASEGSFEL